MAVTYREVGGAWWVFVRHHGQRKSKSIGRGTAGREAAKVVAKTVSAQLALGDLSWLKSTPQTTPETFAEYAERWLSTTVRPRRKPATAEWYSRVIATHWTPVFGSRPLADITRKEIKDHLAKWLDGGARSKTVQGRLAVLASCLNEAVEEDALKVNPAARLGKWAVRSEEKAAVIEVFQPDESRAILETASRECPEWAPAFLVLFRAGLRLGEMLTLQWEDFDPARRELRIRRTWGSRRREARDNGTAINAPKGNAERRVDVSQQLAATLTKHRSRQQVEALTSGREASPWVFPGADGQPVLPGPFWLTWRHVLQTAGVRHRKPHTTRHTFATRLIEQGESLAYVRDQLGHHSIKITVDLYGHLVPGSNRQAVDKLDALEAVAP
jgi:integrase